MYWVLHLFVIVGHKNACPFAWYLTVFIHLFNPFNHGEVRCTPLPPLFFFAFTQNILRQPILKNSWPCKPFCFWCPYEKKKSEINVLPPLRALWNIGQKPPMEERFKDLRSYWCMRANIFWDTVFSLCLAWAQYWTGGRLGTRSRSPNFSEGGGGRGVQGGRGPWLPLGELRRAVLA